ncbi:MAG: cell division protein ZapA [Defluviitaleaceae bacterium]|nr:cell division protein ZapA [Defluviitaleaceae bacterium]
MANKVDVVICGEVITLKSNEEEAHLQRIARYIDRKLADLTAANATASINERIRTLLIALNVADDYFKASDNLARTNAMNEKYVHELGRMQQEYALLKEKFHELQGELALAKAELESKDSTNVLSLPRKIK